MTTAVLPFPRMRASLPKLRRSRRRDLVEVPGRADVLGLAAVLLRYPDDAWLAQREAIGAAVDALPPSRAAELLATACAEILALAALDAMAARQDYVEAFDLRRDGSPYLSYYLHGDSRRRGMALLGIKQRYRSAGFVPDDAELPDHLPTVLEFAAWAGTGAGESILRAHRPGLELIRAALERRRSPYRHVVEAVGEVLGALTEAQRERALEAAREGADSADLVGLDSPGHLSPYGNPELPGVDWAQCPPSSLPSAGSTPALNHHGGH
jgi:nitrate reductase delta subunit